MALPHHASPLKVLLLRHGLDSTAVADLLQAGLQPVASTHCLDLVRDALQQGQDGGVVDVVLVLEPNLSDALLQACAELDEAFAILRSASMQGQRRVGEVSQQLISTAGQADAINRAGQLCMLSQCLVKLALLAQVRQVAPPGQLRQPAAACKWPRQVSRGSKSLSA